MNKLGVVIYVTDEVMEKGGVIGILTRKVPAAEFAAQYPATDNETEIPGAPEAERRWHGTATGPVTIVYLEVPDDNDYTYRFRAVPRNGVAADTVAERVLSVGGTSIAADGTDLAYAEFGLIRAHEIPGLTTALAWVPLSGDYPEAVVDCLGMAGLRVCTPNHAALVAQAEYLSPSTPSVAPRHPWER